MSAVDNILVAPAPAGAWPWLDRSMSQAMPYRSLAKVGGAQQGGCAPLEPMHGVAALVESARNGDRAAFASLHAQYAGMIHAILLARVAPDDAEDLVQDVFMTAMQRLSSLRDAE